MFLYVLMEYDKRVYLMQMWKDNRLSVFSTFVAKRFIFNQLPPAY